MKAFFLLLGLALFVPSFLNHNGSLEGSFPRVEIGDESHHLLMTYSLIADGDLDLKNNYRAVHEGSDQAGIALRGQPLDHHVVWYREGRNIQWWQVYFVDGSKWDRSPHGTPIPRARVEVPPGLPELPEYSNHPYGLPLLLAPFLYPFRGAPVWIERMALILMTATSLVGAIGFSTLLRHFGAPEPRIRFVTALAWLGTPIWYYSGRLFAEGILTALVVWIYALGLAERRWCLVGLLVGLGMQMKLPFVLVAVPLLLATDLLRSKRNLFAFVVPILGSVACSGVLNFLMFGAPDRLPQRFWTGDLVHNFLGFWFDLHHGLLPFVPAVLVAAVAWPGFIRRHGSRGASLLAGFTLYAMLVISWNGWFGGACFGPRLIAPVLPLLLASLVALPGWGRIQQVLIGASFVFGAFGAIHHSSDMKWHPVELLLRNVSGSAHRS